MSSARPTEHFVTLFDGNFLPAGLCLYESLKRHAGPFRLWVLCMDDIAAERLLALKLPEVSPIRLPEVETDALRRAKADRTTAEYCWTLTPFTPRFVMERDPSAKRVTYLDADLLFFDDPAILLDEFAGSGADVLITEHAYAPEYDYSRTNGVYCVQFITFSNTPPGRGVLEWWQERCLEWCYARLEDGKFGDQKYLDDWPARFGGRVHVLRRKELALGPWNARLYSDAGGADPVFFHFHGARLVTRTTMLLTKNYRIDGAAFRYYREYCARMGEILRLFDRKGWAVPILPPRTTLMDAIKDLVRGRRARYHPVGEPAGSRPG